jgi:phenylalanyl-tRNA synthetase beta chain
MIVTRTWLEEFIDLEGISNDELYATFNAIGLEVARLKAYTIAPEVVVGKIVACDRHPDADKLSLCRIDIGEAEPKQIVCGAANVVDAEYVAVAKVGAVLPGDFVIQPATLRGVESFGMVCSAEELGLPPTDAGIMILDESIGELIVGKALQEYPILADTVIELELTANRGDCLSIHGVARDLSAALDRPLKPIDIPKQDSVPGGIARKIAIRSEKVLPAHLRYMLAQNDGIDQPLRMRLRLGFVEIETATAVEAVVRYTTHATGVIVRAYDAKTVCTTSEKIELTITQTKARTIAVANEEQIVSHVGIRQEEGFVAYDQSEQILFEASYADPDYLVETVAMHPQQTDALYYNTSRGSEPDLKLGMRYLRSSCSLASDCLFYDGDLAVRTPMEERSVSVSIEQLSAIVGNPLSRTTVHKILKRLGFEVRTLSGDTFGVHVPPHRHDIRNIQDIAEEVLRMMGIDNVVPEPLRVIERDRTNDALRRHRIGQAIRQRSVAEGFFETVTYVFTERAKLERYGFETLHDEQDLANPIVEELNTLRSTLMINLLEAARRNVKYGIRRIALFEIGPVFDAKRRQHEHAAWIWSGQAVHATVTNHGKAPVITWDLFLERLKRIIGDVTLRPISHPSALMHPYRAAELVRDGRSIGTIAQLHPAVADAYDLPTTYMAEIEWDALMPAHVLVAPISNFQGTYKDLSVLVDEDLPYDLLAKAIAAEPIALLKRFYPIDLYRDASLGGQKSVTIRLYLQSADATLSETQIESTVAEVRHRLEQQCGAKLR